MYITPENKIKNLIVIGDRVLIKPLRPEEKTSSGLYLPQGVSDGAKVSKGYVVKTGPGYALPLPIEEEPWKSEDDQVKYLPLQAKEGDLAIFLIHGATEIKYDQTKYYIVPQNAILLLEREEDLD